jgi:hypothetical protein
VRQRRRILGFDTKHVAVQVERYQIVIEVDVPAAESGHEYDDAMRRAHVTVTGHLWRSLIPEDVTLAVFELVDPADADDTSDDDDPPRGHEREAAPSTKSS